MQCNIKTHIKKHSDILKIKQNSHSQMMSMKLEYSDEGLGRLEAYGATWATIKTNLLID